MRGKVATAAPLLLGSGITPAYAGKSLTVTVSHASESGSPPPMRGKASFVL